jgi:dihydropteroate synthase
MVTFSHMSRITTLVGIKIGPGQPVKIMGVINASPESFYKGSVAGSEKTLIGTVERMEKEGADLLDVGAMSTAPYLEAQIPEAEETKRMRWAVKTIRKHTRLPLSIDTSRFGPAEAGLAAGGQILNDVTGLRGDIRLRSLVKYAPGLILMAHPLGLRKNRILDPIVEVKRILRESLDLAKASGARSSNLVIDPGIGFFRQTNIDWWRWDIEILRHLKKLTLLPAPILVGVSRKSFIGRLLGGKQPEERLYGSLAATVVAVDHGASIIRTHDVAATKDAVHLTGIILGK